MDTGQLRAPESARESDQHQSCVSKAEQVLAPGGDDPADVCREKRGLSVLRGADGAADTLERLAHDKVAGRGGRVGEARGLMRLGDRSETAGDGARRQCGGAVRNVEGNGLRCRGKRWQLVIAAPGLEVAPVISVSLQCGGGLGCGNEGLGLLDQFLKAGGFRDKRIYMEVAWGISFPKNTVVRSSEGSELRIRNVISERLDRAILRRSSRWRKLDCVGGDGSGRRQAATARICGYIMADHGASSVRRYQDLPLSRSFATVPICREHFL